MFFDQLDERNAAVKSILIFEKVGQVGLADLENRLSRLWLVQHPRCRFPHPCARCDDPTMLSGQFWVSTYAPYFLVKLAY
jgi:hypothetical protein